MDSMDDYNKVNTWQQGKFVDHPRRYKHMDSESKARADQDEKLNTCMHPVHSNPICRCAKPEMSEWIAKRLNLAADLEKLALNVANYTRADSVDKLRSYMDGLAMSKDESMALGQKQFECHQIKD